MVTLSAKKSELYSFTDEKGDEICYRIRESEDPSKDPKISKDITSKGKQSPSYTPIDKDLFREELIQAVAKHKKPPTIEQLSLLIDSRIFTKQELHDELDIPSNTVHSAAHVQNRYQNAGLLIRRDNPTSGGWSLC